MMFVRLRVVFIHTDLLRGIIYCECGVLFRILLLSGPFYDKEKNILHFFSYIIY
jgi:hypothetical protein